MISVIVPVYNAAETIGEQLDALARQVVDVPWEILVCDNGSTDQTRAVVEQWRAKLPQLRLIDASRRRGASAARNVGAAASGAPYLVFCDADDVVADDWLLAFSSALERAPYVGGQVEFDRLNSRGNASVTWSHSGPFVFKLEVLPDFPATGSGSFGIRRDLYCEVNGFDEDLRTCEDADLAWRIQLAGYPLSICDAEYHLRQRRSLRKIARQSYSWGTGQAVLSYRYARVIRAIGDLNPPTDPSSTSRPPIEVISSGGRWLRAKLAAAFRRLAAGEIKPLIANATWQVGHQLGRRFGKPDTNVTQIDPPPNLNDILIRVRRQPWVPLAREETARPPESAGA
ncbi:glycosyltransferase [Planctomonas sp. JC2975]|uniref:glycosyltransferase n=1 Tax=Planctomonas sp. JC2975 TaxID=2729626 RepID=UPI00147530DE|nr:glycosyltransferase [Planctomonas sp. JC2975]NNC11880.1 glycosyltransferase [Planctomonas sp. JC2975]